MEPHRRARLGGRRHRGLLDVARRAGLGMHGSSPRTGTSRTIDARHADGRRLIVEAKGFSRDSGADLDTGYGQLLRRMKGEPATTYALVVAGTVVRFAQRVPADVRRRLGISLYTVDTSGKVALVDGLPL